MPQDMTIMLWGEDDHEEDANCYYVTESNHMNV